MFELSEPATAAELEACYDFRWRELRAPWDMPRGSERDELEDNATHIVARTKTDEIVAVGRVHLRADGGAQIRYMATANSHRGLGIGRAIVEHLERVAKTSGASWVIVNARENALPFYEKLGYRILRDSPTLIGTIRHKLMSKPL